MLQSLGRKVVVSLRLQVIVGKCAHGNLSYLDVIQTLEMKLDREENGENSGQ